MPIVGKYEMRTRRENKRTDDTLDLDGMQRLLHGRGAADFNNMLAAETTWGQRLRLLAPVGGLLVVDDMVRAVLLEQLCLLRCRCRRDHTGTGRLGELYGEDGHTASSLCEHSLAGLEGLETVECVPGGECGARKC